MLRTNGIPCWARHINRCNKSITVMRQSLHEGWFLGIVAQSGAQLIDGLVQTALEINEGVFRPELPAEFVPGYHFAGALQQKDQRLERLFLKIDSRALTAQLAGAGIDFERAETD